MGFKAALPVGLRTISATYNISINLINANAMSQIRSARYWGEVEKEITAPDIKLSNIFHTVPLLHPSQLGHIK